MTRPFDSGEREPQLKATREKTTAERTDDARRHFFQVWMVIGAAALIYMFGFVLDVLSLPVAIIVWTIVFVLVLRSPVDALERRGVRRGLGTTIAFAGMFAVLAALVVIMFSPMFGVNDQFANIFSALPVYVQGLIDWANSFYDRYASLLQDDTVRGWIDAGSKSLADWASSVAKQSANGVVLFGTGIANVFVVLGFALVVAFWTLMELPAIDREVDRLVPDNHKEEADMLRIAFTRIMGGYIRATVLQCFIIGTACGIGFAVLGVPNAAALGLITGVLNLIPVVGPWIGGAVAAVVGLFVSPITAVLALVLTVCVQQFVYTFIGPKLMQNSVDVHPAIVIVALLVGGAIGQSMGGLMGNIVGMLLSIPFAAIAKTVFVYYFEKNTGRQIVAEDGVFFRGNPSVLDGENGEPDAMADAISPTPSKAFAPSSLVVALSSHGEKVSWLRLPRRPPRPMRLFAFLGRLLLLFGGFRILHRRQGHKLGKQRLNLFLGSGEARICAGLFTLGLAACVGDQANCPFEAPRVVFANEGFAVEAVAVHAAKPAIFGDFVPRGIVERLGEKGFNVGIGHGNSVLY